MNLPLAIDYVTSSSWKQEENQVFLNTMTFPDGTPVSECCMFRIRSLRIPEMLEVDVEKMVRTEVQHAYRQIRVPCIVEHAGLIFEDFRQKLYPGGLTKPMWDTLHPHFLEETHSAGRRAIARAVVAYCDGMSIRTFVGETTGQLADAPRGNRDFYWDNVFIPDDPSGKAAGKTYAEIVEDPELGLEYKITELSQSSRAMMKFLMHLRSVGLPELWR